MIMDYNRVVKDLNGLTPEQFLDKVREVFEVRKLEKAAHPEKKGEVALFLEDQWYLLTLKPAYENTDPVEGLDVSVLQKQILGPVLGIQDPKTDKRIDFVGGIRGLSELERRVHTDMKAAFAMYPTSIGELFAVADAGRLMPPKSTWFEPKLRSGLFIHSLKDDSVLNCLYLIKNKNILALTGKMQYNRSVKKYHCTAQLQRSMNM